MQNKVYCGFSVNPELYFKYTKGINGKNPINEEGINLSGSTVNISKCLQNMGHLIHALILTAPKNGVVSTMYYNALIELLHDEQISHTHYEILTTPSYAHINILEDETEPYPELLSKKGKIISERIPEVIQSIKSINDDITWTVCSGLQVSEKELAMALYERGEKGKRVLVPKPELIRDNFFDELLSSVDLLIMNESEFELYPKKSPELLLECGPRIVIITKDKKGGEIYTLEGNISYDAYPVQEKAFSPVGTGDWFTGGFISWCLENSKNLDLSLSELKQTANFAAQVAARKLSYPGGSNGPMRKDIII